MLALLLAPLALALVSETSASGWRSGHSGIDRPGAAFLRTEECTVAECCFDLCHVHERCESWSVVNGTCSLRDSVPKQVASRFASSGVKRAVSGLQPLMYTTFPIGSISASGWLRSQLVLTANGQAGHLPEFWVDVMDSVWIGGSHDNSGAGHERGPCGPFKTWSLEILPVVQNVDQMRVSFCYRYWLNGVVPLAAALQASGDSYAGVNATMEVDLQSRVGMWISYILEHQLPSGWLGPDDHFGGQGSDYWSGWNVALSLLQYADASSHGAGDRALASKCEAAVLAYIQETHRRMLVNATASWSQLRWQDWVAIIHQLLDQAPQGQEQALWDAAELTEQQSYDWDAYYHRTGIGGKGALGAARPSTPVSTAPPDNGGIIVRACSWAEDARLSIGRHSAVLGPNRPRREQCTSHERTCSLVAPKPQRKLSVRGSLSHRHAGQVPRTAQVRLFLRGLAAVD